MLNKPDEIVMNWNENLQKAYELYEKQQQEAQKEETDNNGHS